MPEKIINLKPVGVEYTCDKCGKADLQHTGLFKEHNSQGGTVRLFQHKCPACGEEKLLPEIYPLIRMMPATTDAPTKPTKPKTTKPRTR